MLRVLAFAPAAVLPAAIDWLLVSIDAEVVGVPQVLVHAVLWLPASLVVVGFVLAWRGMGSRWVLIPLSVLSFLLGVGITIENWPFLPEEPLAFAWTCWLFGASLLVWLPSR